MFEFINSILIPVKDPPDISIKQPSVIKQNRKLKIKHGDNEIYFDFSTIYSFAEK